MHIRPCLCFLVFCYFLPFSFCLCSFPLFSLSLCPTVRNCVLHGEFHYPQEFKFSICAVPHMLKTKTITDTSELELSEINYFPYQIALGIQPVVGWAPCWITDGLLHDFTTQLVFTVPFSNILLLWILWVVSRRNEKIRCFVRVCNKMPWPVWSPLNVTLTPAQITWQGKRRGYSVSACGS